MEQHVKIKLDQGETWKLKTGRMLFSLILLDLYSEYFIKETLEGYGGFKIGQVIHTVKYVDYLVLLDQEEAML
jgi:hypothetical protein